jgi:N-dimethylarginine dimethylaminohydrolase
MVIESGSPRHRVIMADPRYFDVAYSINPLTPWPVDVCGGAPPVNRSRAAAQWERLYERLEDAGVSVSVVGPPPRDYPDFVFVKNAAFFVTPNNAILARFANPERRGEEEVVRDWLRTRGVTVHELPVAEGLYFEGGGDAIWSHEGRHLWIAYGAGRTTRAGAEMIRTLIRELTTGVSVHLLRTVSPTTYHLDLCFLPVGLPPHPRGCRGSRRVLVQRGSFTAAGLTQIERVFGVGGVVRVPPRYLFACNSAVVPSVGVIITPKLAAEGYRAWLAQKTGMRVVEVNVSEFQKAGGAVACMILSVGTE